MATLGAAGRGPSFLQPCSVDLDRTEDLVDEPEAGVEADGAAQQEHAEACRVIKVGDR